MSRTLKAAALEYAARGWPVFPLWPRTKQPLTKNGFDDASTDAALVARWWTEHPSANIGLEPGRAGFVVFDVDTPEAEAAAQTLGLLSEPTLTVQTGKGKHLYYIRPPGPTSNVWVRDVLLARCDRGYVLLPPSVHPDGPIYRWIGKVDEAKPLPPEVLTLFQNGRRLVRAQPLAPGALIPEGIRHTTLVSLAGTMRRRGFEEPEIDAALQTVNVRRCRPPLPEDEVVRIARDIAKYEPEDPILKEPTDTQVMQKYSAAKRANLARDVGRRWWEEAT